MVSVNSNTFEAEIVEVKSRKLISNDIEYKIILRGSDPTILEFGKLPAETIVKVTIEI